MASKAHIKFKKTITRCEDLANLHTILSIAKQQNTTLDIPASKDILRASVTLAVAALDAYITDVFTENLVPYLKSRKPSKSLIKLLSDAGLNTEEALTLISMDRPYRRIRTLVSKHYSSHVTQQFRVIDELFLPYGLKDITHNAEKRSGRTSLKSSVSKLITRRHKIVHSGDYNSHGRITAIDKNITTRIKDLEILVNNIEIIIENKMSHL